jgi:hypothetical protein
MRNDVIDQASNLQERYEGDYVALARRVAWDEPVSPEEIQEICAKLTLQR